LNIQIATSQQAQSILAELASQAEVTGNMQALKQQLDRNAGQESDMQLTVMLPKLQEQLVLK
jgi:hypothetical protein